MTCGHTSHSFVLSATTLFTDLTVLTSNANLKITIHINSFTGHSSFCQSRESCPKNFGHLKVSRKIWHGIKIFCLESKCDCIRNARCASLLQARRRLRRELCLSVAHFFVIPNLPTLNFMCCINTDEVAPSLVPSPPGRQKTMLELLDTDGDGKISEAAFLAFAEKLKAYAFVQIRLPLLLTNEDEQEIQNARARTNISITLRIR